MSKKAIIISVVVAVVIAVSVAIYFAIKAAKNKQSGGNGGKWANVAQEPTTFPLSVGSTGKAVKVVQAITGVPVDGIFGDRTKGGVITYYGYSGANGGAKPSVSKDDFKLMVSSELGLLSDVSKKVSNESYFYQIASILANGEPGDITYQDYIDLVNKVFDLGLTADDFK